MAHLPHLKAQFSRRCTLLADDEDMKQKKGKPAGDVFLLAMERMNVALLESAKDSEEGGSRLLKPEECLVFEDSIAGVKAGRAAGMRVCWVPHVGLRKVCVGLEKMVLAGNMEEVETRLLEREGTSMDLDATGSVEGEGEVEKIESEDGWAEMIGSLEDFDYARYGIQLKE